MPKKAKELSAIEIKRVTEPGYHPVGGVAGLVLQVTDAGARTWILRATVGSKRREIGLGGYPDVSLAKAREKAQEARDLIQQGIDPVERRKALRASLMAAQAKVLTFDEAARRCHQAKVNEFRSAKHRLDWLSSLERYASPMIGSIPVSDIELPHILRVLEPIWHDKTETATRVRQRIESVLAWATVGGFRSGDNPARWKGNLSEVMAKPGKIRKVEHRRAIHWEGVPGFMSDLREREGMGARALEFVILTAARSGEARLATWDEIDFEARVWTVPGDRMKAGKKHRVPLSADAIKLLKALPHFNDSNYLFSAPRGGPLSDMSISAVTRRMGVDAVPHGFRSNFKDWARNRTRYPDEVSELALAHVNSDATRAAYARDELLPARARMMAEWAKFLNTPITKGDVIPMRARA